MKCETAPSDKIINFLLCFALSSIAIEQVMLLLTANMALRVALLLPVIFGHIKLSQIHYSHAVAYRIVRGLEPH